MKPKTNLNHAETRMARWMVLTGVLMAGIVFIAGTANEALGFLIGATLGLLNFLWLNDGVKALLEAGEPRVPRTVVFKMLVRYPLALGFVFLIYQAGWVPVLPVIIGLLVPGAGVLIECLILIVSGFAHDRVTE